MLTQLLSIARNTFTEAIRQPIFVVLILVGGLCMVFNPLLSAYTMDDDNKLLVDMGLSTIFLLGLLLSAFTATGVLNQEIVNRTVLTVVSKPVSRPLFIVGKFLGVAGAILLACWTLSIMFLLSVRHAVMQTAREGVDGPVVVFGIGSVVLALLLAAWANFTLRRVFASTFVVLSSVGITLGYALVLLISKEWAIQSPLKDLDGQLLLGVAMVVQSVLILAAVAVTVSTRLGQVMTLLVCFGVFFLGLMSDYLLGRAIVQEQFPITRFLYHLIPNLQFLWPADALTQGHDISGAYFAGVTAYAWLLIAALLAVAVVLFQEREVG